MASQPLYFFAGCRLFHFIAFSLKRMHGPASVPRRYWLEGEVRPYIEGLIYVYYDRVLLREYF